MLSQRLIARVTMIMPDVGVKLSGRSQARLYRWTGGRLGGKWAGNPVLILTTTGRRSGEQRSTVVLYERDGDRLVVIGSNTGSERPPAWALNLLADPRAEVQVGRTRKQVRAVVADDSERARLWHLMSDSYDGFEMYTAQTARDFKVFMLEPA